MARCRLRQRLLDGDIASTVCGARRDDRAVRLELLAKVADLARALHPDLAERIWTGSVMQWSPPRQFTYVTAIADQVPPSRLGDLVDRLLDRFVEPSGRLIISACTNPGDTPRDLFADLTTGGHKPDGTIFIERPGRGPFITAWLDA